MEKQYTLSIFTENSPGVLQRITIMFTRRKINIESLAVSETERKGISRFTIVICCDSSLIHKIARQIQRIIEVLHVDVFEDADLYHRELSLIRVQVNSEEEHKEILAISQQFEARVTLDKGNDIILEAVDTRSNTDALVAALMPYRIIEFVRSGRIALPWAGTTHEEAIRLAL
ncbi:MAG: acetolactate synthase small subunit [Bdellovibrionales bacterium]|nr:acetolactate synthase small subunit [Bdellovibrionales bacterium]